MTPVQTYLQSAGDLERGRALFAGSCAGYCHALEPDDREAVYLFDCEWKHGDSDEELFTIITEGILDTRMVGFGPNFPEGDDDKYRIIAFLRANQESCS